MCPEIGKQSVWCPHTAEPHDTALETQVWSLIECENAFNGLKKLHFSLWIECMFRYINIFTQKNCFPPSFMPQLFIEFLLCARNIRQWKKKKKVKYGCCHLGPKFCLISVWLLVHTLPFTSPSEIPTTQAFTQTTILCLLAWFLSWNNFLRWFLVSILAFRISKTYISDFN